MKSIQLVIPAAGLGSRFAAAGIDTPKPLIQVINLPMIAWVIGNFELQSTDTVIIITRPELGIEKNLSEYTSNLPCKVEFIYVDYVTEGPAISVSLAKPKLDMNTALIVANSDQFVSADLSKFVNSVRNSESHGQILTMSATGTKWSYIKRMENGLLSEVREKVEISNEATVGIYGWSKCKSFFDSLDQMIAAGDRTNGEFYVAPTYNYLIQAGEPISGHNIGDVENQVHGLGTPEDLETFLNQDDLRDYFKLVEKNLGIMDNSDV